MSMEFPFRKMKKFWNHLETDCGDGWFYNNVNVLNATELHTLKWLKWGLPWWRSG